MKSIAKAILLGIALSHSTASYADDWSIGLFAGQADVDLSPLDESCRGLLALILTAEPADCESDDSDTSIGVNIGYHFSDGLGLEAGYIDLGDFETALTIGGRNADGFTLGVNADALYVAGTASLLLSDRWSLTGRLGYFELNADIDFDAGNFDFPPATSYEDDGLYTGASLNYQFSDQWTAQLRYDDVDIDLVSLGVSFKF